MSRRQARSNRFEAEPLAAGRSCEEPNCGEAATHRAPRSPSALNEYRWFCLDHVREYNRNWDYYKGMSQAQIEQEVRRDTTWQRPTWPLGGGGHSHPRVEGILRDPLGSLHRAARPMPQPEHERAPVELAHALETLGLGWPVATDEAKARYKALAKLHHPDANGGDPAAEERLKIINAAWGQLHRALRPKAA
jgi:DnaJ domain